MSSAVVDELPEAAPTSTRWLARVSLVVAVIAMLYVAFTLYLQNQVLFGLLVMLLAMAVLLIFGASRFYAARFIFPGLAAVLFFIAFPVLYTIYLGFTNYSSFNLLTFERATDVVLDARIVDTESQRPFSLVAADGGHQLYFPEVENEGGGGYLSESLVLDGSEQQISVTPVDTAPADVLAMRDVVKLRGALAGVEVLLPDGTGLKNSGLRAFANVTPEYTRQTDGTLVSNVDETVLTADQSRGFYIDQNGKRHTPGWRVWTGGQNFERIFKSRGIREPMLTIFIWTVVFALLSVSLTFAVGLALASVLQWPHLRGKTLYRVLLILPYAVPAFISILIFRGLFNQNFGEINMILEALMGIRPHWFTDGSLSRLMVVIVNVWLGYPYMMLLAMGFLQSVPEDHKKAAALEGASVLRVFFTITLPQIVPPFLPLLIASFAFNFNNIVLILLLTNGMPDIPGTIIPAGQTDILGSFTFRLAFQDSGQQFGLAGAITFLIFIVVSVLAYANFVAMRKAANKHLHGQ